jgi:hypothetical protein
MRRAHPRLSGRPADSLKAGTSWPREAFIPAESPYLEQAMLGEPKRRCNVLFPDRRSS